MSQTLGCSHAAVSVAMEPVAPERWADDVYAPFVEGEGNLLIKTPDYSTA